MEIGVCASLWQVGGGRKVSWSGREHPGRKRVQGASGTLKEIRVATSCKVAISKKTEGLLIFLPKDFSVLD